jgi:hypothetical protein
MSLKQSAMSILRLGCWLAVKWRTRLVESGGDYQAVARQMKKQGYPLEIALALLVGRVGQ